MRRIIVVGSGVLASPCGVRVDRRRAAVQAPLIHEKSERLSDATQTYETDSDFSLPKFLLFTAFHNRASLFPMFAAATTAIAASTLGTGAAAALGIGSVALLRPVVRGRTNNVRKDLTGKVCIVTGGSRGIGLETAIQLADMGGRVIIAAPADEKDATVAAFAKRAPNGIVTYIPLDLGEPNQILAFATIVKNQFGAVDILVNCAAVSVNTLCFTPGGNERHIGVNFLGPFQLTELLIPLLQKVNGRVVYVTCSSHITAWRSGVVKSYFSPKLTEDTFHPNRQYGASKLGNILHCEMLKYRGGFSVCSVNPGQCDTMIHGKDEPREKDVLDRLCLVVRKIAVKSAYDGSQSVVNCCVRDNLDSGAHYVECTPMRSGLTAVARSRKEAAELCNWAATHTIQKLTRK